VKLVSTSLVVVALALASTQVATPSPAAAPTVVHATIWPNLIITFSPATFKKGTVVIKVKNRATKAHLFSINGVTSGKIQPHTTVPVTVTFKRAAGYTASLADCGYLSPCGQAGEHAGGNVKVIR
jgi:hypothetical protein